MKTLPVLIAAALVAGLACAYAQEPALVVPAAPSVPASESGLALPADGGGDLLPPVPPGSSLLTLPPALTPPAPVPETTPGADAGIPASAILPKGTAEQLRQAIRIRELKTELLSDPEVQAQKLGAQCAKTMAGRNVWMRNYYTLLYTKMEKIDPSLYEELESQLHQVLARYEQHHVRPSVLIEDIKELPGSRSCDHLAKVEAPAKAKKDSSKKAPGRLPLDW